MFWIWIIVVILLAIVELLTINLTTIWFSISGLIALITSLYTENFLIQFGLFIILGLLLLITIRPSFKKILKQNNIKINRVLKK